MTDDDFQFAARVTAVAESKTTRFFGMVQSLRQQGRRIISLAVGEPDFDTPEAVIRATREALASQATRYGAVAGELALRRDLAQAFEGYGPGNILITNGAKQGLFEIFQALCNPGDEVIIPSPCWVSFAEQVRLAGGRPVLVDTVDHQIDPDIIQKAVTPRTRAILVNTPNNPTGAVYPAEALATVARIAAGHGLYLIADEAYHAFTFDGGVHRQMYDLATDRRQLVTVRSFSKQYNMTGFRLGYVVADAALIEMLVRLQSHMSGNVCTFSQYGGLAALEMDQNIVEQRRAALQRRRDIAYGYARELFDCIRPQGAFYLFPDVRPYLRPGENSEVLAMRLLDQASVAVVPGEAFGAAGHIRISYTVSEADLHLAFEKMKEAL